MRILYLHQYFITPAMSGGTRSYEMARRLNAAGHDVQMITSDQGRFRSGNGWRESVESGINVHWYGVPYANEMGFVSRLWAFVKFAYVAARRATVVGGDVVFASSTPLTIAVPALVASWWLRVPFVFEVRDLWPDVPIAIGALRSPIGKWLARLLESITYSRAAHIVALAPGMRDDIIAKGVPANKVSVIPNGCDLDVFGQRGGETLRSSYAWLGDRKLLLFAGTFGAVNGVGYLVDVAAAVGQIDPEVRVVVIGDGREREQVRRKAAEKGILDRSFFMFDSMPKGELARWFDASDIVVALFTGPRVVWKDAVQNKFFDALAAGRPVACNFDGWQSRIAVSEGVGFIIDPTDAAAAAGEFTSRLSNTNWILEARRRSRELAVGPFNRDILARKLEALLGEVAGHGGRGV